MRLFYGLAVDSSKDLVRKGFKYLQSAHWIQFPDTTIRSIWYYSSSDTDWAQSNVFPETLVNLDSLFRWQDDFNFDSLSKSGKWFVRCDGNDILGYGAGTIKNFKDIIYLETKKNKMKLQISKIYLKGNINNQYIDSLEILWAVNSLGNGKFDQTTRIKPINKPAGKTGKRELFRLNSKESINNILRSGFHIDLFNPLGKQVSFQTGISDVDRLPPGVLIYRIDNSGQPPVLGKVLLR